MHLEYSAAGIIVGLLVGMTGVGGGALMAPLLILVFGFNPAVAVGTDLWFAAITKTVGSLVHGRLGAPDWRIIRTLLLGSLPACLATLVALAILQAGKLKSDALMCMLGAALLLVAAITLLKTRLNGAFIGLKCYLGPQIRRHQKVAIVAGGALVGCVVTLTSVGAGALVALLLMLVYPLRLDTKSLVGTDIVHAVPLALIAAIGHSWLGNVDVPLLAVLLIGSIPGIVVGSMLVGRINEAVVRSVLAVMLAISGAKMLMA